MRLSWFNRSTVKLIDGVMTLLLAVIFLLVVMNVFCRYALNYSFGWADELSRFLFIWMGFLGTATAFADNQHVSLDMVVERLPRPVARVVRVIAMAGCLVIFAVFLQQGWLLVAKTVNTSPALDIPMWLVYLCVPIGSLLGVVYGVEKILHLLRPSEPGR